MIRVIHWNKTREMIRIDNVTRELQLSQPAHLKRDSEKFSFSSQQIIFFVFSTSLHFPNSGQIHDSEEVCLYHHYPQTGEEDPVIWRLRLREKREREKNEGKR